MEYSDKLFQRINQMSVTSYEGGCHCGAVRFRVSLENLEPVVYDCNCSICHKKGFLHLIVTEENFTLVAGAEHLTSYRFNTGVAQHLFCRVCGIHSFYRPRSHPNGIDINLRCLDQDLSAILPIKKFDGANWEANIEQIAAHSELGN
jgi:hypothetical protein